MKSLLLILMFLSLVTADSITYSIKGNHDLRTISNDQPFSTDIIKGKRFLLNYVDPDKRELNRAFMRELETFNQGKTGSIAIINLAATWLPNTLIESELKESQKSHPTTLYVKDYAKVLVKAWGLKDDDYNTLIFDQNRKLLFKAHGKLSPFQQEEIKKILGE